MLYEVFASSAGGKLEDERNVEADEVDGVHRNASDEVDVHQQTSFST